MYCYRYLHSYCFWCKWAFSLGLSMCSAVFVQQRTLFDYCVSLIFNPFCADSHSRVAVQKMPRLSSVLR